MDDKEVRVDSGLGTNIQNDCNKRLPNGNVTYTSRDKSYSDSSHPLGKTDTRPCAIIGPDRVLPTTNTNDVYMKTIPAEPWEYPDNYRHPYDTIKMSEYHQTHNISPRQTFQENMQRIVVPPTYSSIISSDETSLKNPKLNVPTEGKYCDVPYSINTLSSEPKSVQSDSAMPVINPSFPRGVQPHGWPGGGMQPLKPYQAQDYYHNTEYSNYPAPRPMPIVQPQRMVHDDIHPMYSDRLYQESNIRFKPYPTSKEKFPQSRYEYANTFHPPQTPIPKFDIQKSMHGHPYPMYAQGPYKYTVDRRYPEAMVESHPRALYPQHNAFRTHPVHPSYGPLPGNYYNNKPYPYPTDNPRPMHTNKLSYDANNKIYLELENPKYKAYPSPDNFYYNDRAKLMRGDILLPGHTPMNSMGPQHLYKKDNLSLKSIDHSPNYPYREHRSLGNPLARMPLQFSPNTMSPCDSNTSHEAIMLGIPQEDCGYVSQSSTTSVRSIDSNNSPADFYKRQGLHYNMSTNQNAYRRANNNSKPASSTDNKKGLNLSQFFQMWNEGDEEVATSNANEVQINPNYVSPKPQASNNQEQLYILGSVTVPQEELSKYEHLQKVSKLPENIKGYNNIEILNQFEQLVESPGMKNLHVKNPPSKEYKVIPQTFPTNQIKDGSQRPVSPLDVEAKISQSVIHKEVGCNFEIKPCSPKVLNVDVAAPVHDVLGERFIEKVANPVLLSLGNDAESKIEIVDNSTKVTSCKMANSKYDQNSANSVVVKPLYPLQDLNANMGLCLASLPQLDSDIDLNLPEVNQQFIDANKIEASHRSTHSLLENANIDSSLTKRNPVNKIPEETGIETDKEITKLSKYRKTKKADCYINNQIISSSSISSAQRTDSVIIKNPENVKVCNESQKESSEVEKSVENKTFQERNNNENDAYKKVVSSENFEKAIDFSVNRNEDTTNAKSEVSDSTVSLSKESHLYPSNTNLSVKSSKKRRKSEKSYDLKSPANFIQCDHDSDFYSMNKEIVYDKFHESKTKEKLHEKRIPSEELPIREIQICDYQSETSTSLGQKLNEKHKVNIERNNKQIKNQEISLFTDNPVIKMCDNNLPDLSFELADGCNLQPAHINYNPIRKTNDSKTELTIDIGRTTDAEVNILEVKDCLITNLSEISSCAEQTNSGKNTEKAVNTGEIADTIEKQLEDMDAKYDVTSNDLSNINPLATSETNINVLGQEELNDIQTTNVSVIKLSDLSPNIENEYCHMKSATNDIQKCTSLTNVTIDKEFLESHNEETLLSVTLINEKDEPISKCPSDKENTECEQLLLHESLHNSKNTYDKSISMEGEICCSDNKVADNKLESDTCSKVYCGDYKNTPYDIKANITEGDTNREDCRSPMTVNSCDNDDNSCKQTQEAIEFVISKEAIDSTLQNSNITFKSEDDDKQYVYKKFSSAHHKQWVHRKALFSPFVQKLILYNIDYDNKNLCKNANDTKANILNQQVQLDESIEEDINVVKGSNQKEEVDYVKGNIEENQNFCTSYSEILEVSQTIEETNNGMSGNLDNVYTNHKCSEIIQNSEEVDEKLSETDNTSFLVSSELKHTHPVRSSSPFNFAYNNVKLQKRTCKRSLSDSALKPGLQEDESLFTKRYKRNDKDLNIQSSSIETNLSSILRRNSISEIYNDGNVVILIDKDLILTEESQETKVCFTEEEEITNNYDSDQEIIDAIAENLPEYDKELWVEDVACTETVFSDDVAEDVIGSSPKKFISSNYEALNNESFMLCEEVIKNMENDVDVNELNTCHDSTYSIHIPYDYRDSHVDDIFTCLESPKDSETFSDDNLESNRRKAENILSHFETSTALFPKVDPTNDIQDDKENFEVLNSLAQETQSDMVRNHKLNAQQNSDYENYDSYSCTLSTGNYSSSPEVTSTTCEDKTPGIILKISNHKRSKSQLDDSKPVISYKLTEKKKYKPNLNSSGTLVTKAAQKYIPPIKITISDLKVKLPLPKNSLDKLKQMKKSKVAPKIDKKTIKTYSLSTPREMKKPKPKFEDVLMSIDKFQYNKPKVKNRKTRDQIPKMVIKKNESGSHYTSSPSSSEDTQSPDLTGRKWQPWVFIEKNTFVDKMALKHKVKAIYCRRKKSYILSEKFRKYKSVYNAKFVISQPKNDDLSQGNLKYTIRLKHH